VGTTGHDRHAQRETVLLALGCFITLVWSIALLGALFLGRELDNGVHVVMAAVAAGLFGGAAIAGRKANGKTNGGN
jgi:hypothetical protein